MNRRLAVFGSGRSTKLWLGALAILLAGRPAFALQPLSDFLAGAGKASADAREAMLAAVQQQSESLASLGRALPSLSARGVYTHNQSEARIDFAPPGMPSQSLVIQPLNQLDAYFQLDVPIVDLAAWARLRASKATEVAARHSAEATLLDVQKEVARNYFQLVGALALRQSAQKTLSAAEQNLSLARKRQANGVATELDVQRALSEVERDKGSIADAELSSELSQRALRTLTGIQPQGEAPPMPQALDEETPLESWEAEGPAVPAVRAAGEQRIAAEASALASKFSLLPSLGASGQEHLTNAPGFFGRNSIYVLSSTATWKLDLTSFATMRSQEVAAEISRVREGQARQAALDRIHESWFRVHVGIAKSRAARSAAEAADSAVVHARARYGEGAGTQFELVQAERDAFGAEVSRIQADADLAYARVVLHLDAARPLPKETP